MGASVPLGREAEGEGTRVEGQLPEGETRRAHHLEP